MILLLLMGGFILLVTGAELLVRGASGLAARFGVSSLVIGLTVVAFGTSAPEFAVSMNAALTGNPSIALGNAAGSNIFNLLLILGISGLIMPVAVSLQVIKLDAPIMTIVSLLLLAMSFDGSIGRIDGAAFTILLIAYVAFTIVRDRKTAAQGIQSDIPQSPGTHGLLFCATLVLAGIGLLVIGSQSLTRGAVLTARYFGVSDLVIGLTIVAGGTSLPELATSIAAALRKQPDIAIGNVVGSNIFNILCILGITGLVTPIAVAPEALRFSLPVVAVSSMMVLPLFISGQIIDRFEATILLACYCVYVIVLIIRESAQQDSAPSVYVLISIFFVLMILAGAVPFLRTGRHTLR